METIYQALYNGDLDVRPSACLRSRRRRRRPRQARHTRCRPALPNIAVTMPDGYNADAVVAGLIDGLDRVPGHLLRSITFDQGSEWADWAVVAGHYGIDAWFCDPHSPSQRGQIENQNRTWRWWFPRGTDLAVLEPAHVDHVAAIINNQRRRNLAYHSPAALYAAASTVH